MTKLQLAEYIVSSPQWEGLKTAQELIEYTDGTSELDDLYQEAKALESEALFAQMEIPE